MHTEFKEDYLLVKLTDFDITDFYMAGSRDLRSILPNGIKVSVVNQRAVEKSSSLDKGKISKLYYKKSSRTIEIKMGYGLIKNLFDKYCSIPKSLEPKTNVVYTISIPISWLRKRGVDIDSPVSN